MTILNSLFHEQRTREIKNLLEQAKKDPEAYQKLINELEKVFCHSPGDQIILSTVNYIRRMIWPHNQSPDMFSKVSKETFGSLRNSFDKYSKNFLTSNAAP